MAPAKTGKGAVAEKKTKKEKVYHPESRKAGQINRKAMRRGKLGGLSSNRTKKNIAMADIYGFFYHSMPEDHVMTLDELHRLIRDIWLTRHDEELAAEISARRKGRPKSTREMKLEELQLREQEVYKAGMEVIDLTHPATVQIFRDWDQREVAYIQLLRFIRINSENPESVVVSRPGTHKTILAASDDADMNLS